MLKKEVANEVVDLVQEIQSRLDTVMQIYRDHGGEEEQASYLTMAEFVTGYLHQDVMHPILLEYPELAPDNWKKDDNGQWIRQPSN